MIQLRFSIVLALAASTLFACGGRLTAPVVSETSIDANRQRVGERAFELYLERSRRLSMVSGRLRLHGAAICDRHVAPFVGLATFARRDLTGRRLRDLLGSISNEYELPAVCQVLPGSPAARAGIREGDVVAALNGQAVESSREVAAGIAEQGDNGIELDLRESGATRKVALTPNRACRQRASLGESDVLGVRRESDGSLIVSVGMLDFAESDDELAAALAHAMALDLLDRRIYNDEVPELETARLSLSLLEAAGFDTRAPERLWERLALEHPSEILVPTQAMSLNQHNFPVKLGPLPARILAYRTLTKQ